MPVPTDLIIQKTGELHAVAERVKERDGQIRKLSEENVADQALMQRLSVEVSSLLNGTAKPNGYANGAPAPKPPPATAPIETTVQAMVIALAWKYRGGQFDKAQAMKMLYPGMDEERAYKALYANFTALSNADPPKLRNAGRGQWEPLIPRDPRPILYKNGSILYPDGTIQEAANVSQATS